MKEVSNATKNLFAKYYAWMLKNKLSLEPAEIENSIRVCLFAWDGLGFREYLVFAMVKRIDEIKGYYDNMPKWTINYTKEVTDISTKPHTVTLEEGSANFSRYKDDEFISWAKSYLPYKAIIKDYKIVENKLG